MSVSLREARLGRQQSSLAAVCSWLLVLMLALCGGAAFAQSLTIGTPVNFGDENLQQSTTKQITFTAPIGGVTIQTISVVTQGVTGQDFTLVSAVTGSSASCSDATLYEPSQCIVTVAFTPQQIGLRLGALTITDSSNTIVNTVYLSGVGAGPQFVFQPTAYTAINSGNGLSFTAGTAIWDPNGNIIFTDLANNRILEESSTGIFSVLYSGIALTNTSGLALDGLGNLYISSGTDVYVLAPGASAVTILNTGGVTLRQPSGLALDTVGDLYIVDTLANTVYEISQNPSTGANVGQALTFTGTAGPLNGPTGLAIDANNEIYIADSGNKRIVEVPATTRVAARRWYPPGRSQRRAL